MFKVSPLFLFHNSDLVCLTSHLSGAVVDSSTVSLQCLRAKALKEPLNCSEHPLAYRPLNCLQGIWKK